MRGERGDDGGLRVEPSAAFGIWRRSPQRLAIFSIKITHFYAHFGREFFKSNKSSIKSSLNVLNRINEVQVL